MTQKKPIDDAAVAQLSPPARQGPVRIGTDSCGSRGAEWFCAATIYGQTDLALEHLEKQEFTTFHPLVWERRTKGGRTKREEVPMFPGYIFVQFDLRLDDWRPINSTRGVDRLLCLMPERPHALSLDAIHLVAENASKLSAEFEAMARAKLTGYKLRVTKGPWAGQEGVCLWHAKDRVQLLLSLFGRPTKLGIDVGRVERA